jgi:ribosomal protein L29
MKQSEIKDLSAAELQEKLSQTKKTYADLKWLMLYLQLRIHFKLECKKNSCKISYRAYKKRVAIIAKDGRKRNLRKERVGVVTSDKMDKSIVVAEVQSKTPYTVSSC